MLSWVEHEKSFITSGPGIASITEHGLPVTQTGKTTNHDRATSSLFPNNLITMLDRVTRHINKTTNMTKHEKSPIVTGVVYSFCGCSLESEQPQKKNKQLQKHSIKTVSS